MNDNEPVSWRKPIILGICVLALGLLLAGRAFLGEAPPSADTNIEAVND
jgi:hypothetical protein